MFLCWNFVLNQVWVELAKWFWRKIVYAQVKTVNVQTTAAWNLIVFKWAKKMTKKSRFEETFHLLRKSLNLTVCNILYMYGVYVRGTSLKVIGFKWSTVWVTQVCKSTVTIIIQSIRKTKQCTTCFCFPFKKKKRNRIYTKYLKLNYHNWISWLSSNNQKFNSHIFMIWSMHQNLNEFPCP